MALPVVRLRRHTGQIAELSAKTGRSMRNTDPHHSRRWFASATASALTLVSVGQSTAETIDRVSRMDRLIAALTTIATPECLRVADRLLATGAGFPSFDLHLRRAGLDAQFAALLADAIRHTVAEAGPVLRSFSASYNPDLTDTGITALATAFPVSMTELGFVGCSIGDAGGDAILKWAQRALSPKLICMEQNLFSDAFKEEVAMLRRRTPGLMIIV